MEEDKFYHIYNRANGFENLFISDDNYNYFLRQWDKYISPIDESYVYCLMPNHFHFLVKIRSEKELNVFFKDKLSKGSKPLESLIILQFSHLFNSYTQAFNKVHSRKGSLFQSSFKRKEITSDSYLTNVIFYIHHNPVHHGFTDSIEGWKHSSYHSLTSSKQTKIERKAVNNWFGGKYELQKFHKQNIKNLATFESEYTE